MKTNYKLTEIYFYVVVFHRWLYLADMKCLPNIAGTVRDRQWRHDSLSPQH